jgi:membrane protein
VRLRRTPLDRARFLWHDVRNFVGRVFEGAVESNVPFLASGLTFDALLAAVPFLLLVLSVVGYVVNAGADRAQVELASYLRGLLPAPDDPAAPDVFAPVMRFLEGVVRERGRLTLFGVPLFIWFSTRLFGSLRASLCEVFDTEETRSWVRGKTLDILLVLLATLLFVVNTVLSEGVEVVAGQRPLRLGFAEYFGAQLLAFGIVLVLFAVVFRVAPARRVRWDTALVAAVICALSFEVAKHLLGLYFQNMVRPDTFTSNKTLGALLLFVVWTYYMAVVFLVGGQIAQVYELRRRQAGQRLLLG